ncbi:DNA primase [Amycolatopsis antarctica]|uniref:DNA primase n=1 Tax=Amycolatopsis antarctica TaxID=1854586 RepID=A0A263D7E4_9PSEU|nr:bifunctional DNA primase/polymerase [Amycolatopsis antarctica]OZM73406.1 DNA primase [Amycolatopsis antarctica]
MSEMDWSDGWHGAFRIELRAAAIGLASRGWPVFPGTRPAELSAGNETEWAGPVPAHDNWRERLGAHPQRVAAWWTGQPFSLLVATGIVLDAVEVDDKLGRRAARLLRASGQPAPIVAMPNGRWLFLTTVADRFPAELAAHESITWHGDGSWVPLPPTPFPHGVVHWRVKPEVWGWRLPAAEAMHDVLVRALAADVASVEEADRAHALQVAAA